MFDAKTMLLALSTGNLMLVVLLVLLQKTESLKSVSLLWISGRLLQVIGWLLLALRYSVSDGWSILGANLMMLLAAACEMTALRLFLRRSYGPLPLITAVASLVIFTILYLIGADYQVRSMVASLLMAVIFASIVPLLLENPRKASPLRLYLGATMVISVLLLFLRFVLAILVPNQNLFSPTQSFVYVSAYFFMITNGAGFILLMKEQTDQEMVRLANLDPLTEAFNRRIFFEKMQESLTLASRGKYYFSLLLFDIDFFKNINDTYGHLAGDCAIRDLVGLCRLHLRASDLLGRAGGDEFAVMLPLTRISEACMVAGRLASAVSESAVDAGSHEVRFTISVGVTENQSGDTVETIIHRADQALYAAKHGGRNRVVAYSAPASALSNAPAALPRVNVD